MQTRPTMTRFASAPSIGVVFAVLVVAATGCSSCEETTTPPGDDLDAAGADTAPTLDGSSMDATADDVDPRDGASDGGSANDSATTDTRGADTRTADADTTAEETGPELDTAGDDTSRTKDADARATDTGLDTKSADTSRNDGGDTGPTPPSGLSTRCSQGPGWTLFKFHWSQNSGPSPRIDVWDASCTYSYAPNSACNVQDIRNPGFNNRSPKAILLTQSEYLRVRFSVQGLNFTEADVYVQARSYSTTASTYFRVSSPLYGSKQGGLVDNDFTYDWYRVPWTGYLKPGDDPDLTAIEIYDEGGDALAVHAVELCIR